MTQNTPSISILDGPSRRDAALTTALAALALLGAVAATGTVTAQSEQPTVVVTDGTTAPNGTTVGVVLTNAPNGLSGYHLDLTVENGDATRINSASYPDRFGLTSEPEISADGTAITLEAADMEGAIEPGATNVTLATATITGAAPDEATLSVEPRQFDDDDGNMFTPATQSSSETSSDSSSASIGTTSGNENTAGTDDESSTGTGDDESSAGTGNQETFGPGLLPTVFLFITITVLLGIGLQRQR